MIKFYSDKETLNKNFEAYKPKYWNINVIDPKIPPTSPSKSRTLYDYIVV